MLVLALATFQGSPGAAYDFAAYEAAARRLAAGLPLYQPRTQLGPFAPGPAGLYLYPPPLAVLLLAFVPLAPAVAAGTWQALHVAALIASCAILPVPRAVRLAVFGVASLALPTLLDLNLGNVSVFVLLAGAAAWRWRERPLRGAVGGAATAVAIAMRPQLGILLPWWAWRRCAASLAGSVAAVGLLVGASGAVAGVGAWQAYARLLTNLHGAGAASSDVGAASLALRAGFAGPVPGGAFAAGALLALAGAALATRRDPESGLVATMVASLLVVPLLWPHYLVLLVLPAALLAARGRPWGLALPLLAWLPGPALPFVALAGCWAPLLVPVSAPTAATPTVSRGLLGALRRLDRRPPGWSGDCLERGIRVRPCQRLEAHDIPDAQPGLGGGPGLELEAAARAAHEPDHARPRA